MKPLPLPSRVGHCEQCRKKDTLRPYGPLENGRPLWVCFGCGLAEGFDVMRGRMRSAIEAQHGAQEAGR